jgi:alpha-L-rhamnosidase
MCSKVKIVNSYAILGLLTIVAGCQSMAPTPTGLMCDLLSAPETAVITNRQPEFSWIVNSRHNGDDQAAYQILVADSEKLIAEAKGNLWNSGRIASNQSTAVQYVGSALKSNGTYYWAVRVWLTKSGPTSYSGIQRFHTGDFDAARSWPSESNWLEFKDEGKNRWGFEDRHPIEFQDIPPVKFVKKAQGHYYVDFAKASFATVKVTITNPAAGGPGYVPEVEIDSAECVNADDTLNRTPPSPYVYFEKHTLKLNPGTHTYILELPRHKSTMRKRAVRLPDNVTEVTPFRAIEIIGCPTELKAGDVFQHALYYRFDDHAANFTSSDPVLNQVWDLCKHTLKACSFLGVFVDGNRERLPYEADCHIHQLSQYCVDREYRIERYTHEYLIYHPTWPTEYSMMSVMTGWNDYLYSGDRTSLEKYYDDLKVKTLIAIARPDGLITAQDEDRSHVTTEDFVVKESQYVTPELKKALHLDQPFRDLVDWPPIPQYRDNYEFRKVNTVVNAYHYNALRLMAQIADTLGKTKDAAYYRMRAELHYKTFNEKLFDPAQGLYIDGEGSSHASLHANMFPLSMGLVPPERQAKVIAFIRSKGMRCSVYAAQLLLEAMYRHGQPDYALQLMTATNDTSWYNMIREGATMTAEAWSTTHTKNMPISDIDFNHPWAAAPTNIIANYLMGVRPLEPGFAKMVIQPQPATLKQASLDLPTPRGTVHVDFTNDPGKSLKLNIRIPANTSAQVILPRLGSDNATALVDGKQQTGKLEGDNIVFENICSGKHHFQKGR